MTKNLKLILLAVILLAGIMAMYAGYSFVKNRQTLGLHKGPSIGVVQMEELAKLNPSYGDYEQAKQELAQLQAQYEVEQKALNTKSMMQAEQLKALSQSTDVTDSVNIELKTKVTAKENEMNAQLAEKRKEKKLDVVFQKAAVVNGGVDVTDDVINKLGKAATTSTDTATTAATK